MAWQVEREERYLSEGERIVIFARLSWVYGAIPVLRVVLIAIGIALVESNALGWWLLPLSVLAIQWIRSAGFAGDLGFFAVAAIIALTWFASTYALDDATRWAVLAAVLTLSALHGVLEYYVTLLYVTDKRIIMRSGLLTERRSTLPLRALTDMRYDQTLLGRMFDFGHFFVESAGQQQALSSLRFVNEPRRFYRTVMGLALGGHIPPDVAEQQIYPWE